MAETYNGGITVTFPSAGEVNWTAVFREFARVLSDHDHTGGGRGTKISGSALGIDAFTGDSFRLNFNQWLRSRNDLNTADVNMIRITTDNEMEIAPVVRGGVFFIDALRVNAAAGPYNAIIQNNFDDGVGLNLVAGIGALGFRLDSNIVSGDAIYTDYVNQGALVFQETVNTLGEKAFAPGGIEKFRMTNVAFMPTSTNAFDLGSSSFHFANGFIDNVHTSTINASLGFSLNIDGVTYWSVNAAGNLLPAGGALQDIGTLGLYVDTIFVNNIAGNTKVDISVGGTAFIGIASNGTVVPYQATQDIGSPSNKWRNGYFSNTVNSPIVTATQVNVTTLAGVSTINGNVPYVVPVWTDWSPTMAILGGVPHGVVLISARYYQEGKFVYFQIAFTTFTNTGPLVPYSDFTFTSPVTTTLRNWGTGWATNAADGSGRWPIVWSSTSSTLITFNLLDTATSGQKLTLVGAAYKGHDISGCLEAA